MPVNPDFFNGKTTYFVTKPEPPSPAELDQIKRRRSILPNRHVMPIQQPPPAQNRPEVDSRTCEAITKFLTTNGLPFDTIDSRTFQDLLLHLNPSVVLPNPEYLGKMTERMGSQSKFSKSFAKASLPISVTVDVVEKENGDNFLVFSIHFFEGFHSRKCLVYLRKLLLSEIDTESIVICIRRTISNFNCSSVKVSNLVMSNPRLAELFRDKDFMQNQYLSFYHYLSIFVRNILKIECFDSGLKQLRQFVRTIKMDADLYCKFRRAQLVKNANLNLPTLDNEASWQSTTTFLTKCLILHPSFIDFAMRWELFGYIQPETFEQLTFLLQLLLQCSKQANELSTPLNTISQVVPAIMNIRNYISETLNNGHVFEGQIRNELTQAFQEITSGPKSTAYDIATLFDPRFAYNESIYTRNTWTQIEQVVVEELANKQEFTTDRRGHKVIIHTDEYEKKKLITGDFIKYRKLCKVQSFLKTTRPDVRDDPFRWWEDVRADLESISDMAKEYLACPAVTIDANYYFGDAGKFLNICKNHDLEHLEYYLNVAGAQQEFRGYGAETEKPPHHSMALLNSEMNRRRHVALCAREMNRQLASVAKNRNVRSGMPSTSQQVFRDVLNFNETGGYYPVSPDYSAPSTSTAYTMPSPQTVEEIKEEPIEEPEIKLEPMEFDESPSENVLVRPNNEKIYVRTVIIPKGIAAELPPPRQVKKKVQKEIVEEEKPERFEEEEEEERPHADPFEGMRLAVSPSFDAPPQRPPPNRRCTLCELIHPSHCLKSVTIDSEKVFLLLGGVLSKRLTLQMAHRKFFRPQVRSYYCLSHFGESAKAVLTELFVQTAEQILDCSEAMFAKIIYSIKVIRNQPIRFPHMRVSIASLVGNYYAPPQKTILFHHRIDKRPNDVTDNSIIPKEERMPRKQVFDEEETPKTVKMIKEKPYIFLDNSEFTEIEGDGKCCFCSMTSSRDGMMKVPKSAINSSIWTEKLGEKFMSRLKPDSDNLICRSHFSKEAFSKRGRLLKGKTPDTVSTTVEVTYEINGDDFIKVNEQVKSGTAKRAASVDLETLGEDHPEREDDVKRARSEEVLCCFCCMIERRRETETAPDDQQDFNEWIKKLGEEFVQNLGGQPIKFVCQKHFGKEKILEKAREKAEEKALEEAQKSEK